MGNFIPDIYQKSIYMIDYQKLKERGIKCLLFDVDNTLVPISIKVPNKKIKDLFNEIKEKGFKIILFSNSHKRRLKVFKDELEVDCCAFACKPFSKKFLAVLKEYNYNVSEVAIIGDQLLTDVLGGNKVGITTILVNPISPKDAFFTKIMRRYERRIFFKLRKNNLFIKGKYYE
ncbi:MAG: YqeG family HAD IIIA-type phosphatase [Mollicutes bacterium]|nr:YqeG family HAD IIIA-type phosphatase [Mollicutes bacterium]